MSILYNKVKNIIKASDKPLIARHIKHLSNVIGTFIWGFRFCINSVADMQF